MFLGAVLLILIPTAAAATTICEQLILPGLEDLSYAPARTPTRLSIRSALALGKKLAKLDDHGLVDHLYQALPAGVMIAAAGAEAIRGAVDAGQFAGTPPTAAQLSDVHKSVDSARNFVNARWMHGVTTDDVSFADLVTHLVVPRDAARVEADGRYALGALGLSLERFAPLTAMLGQLVQQEGSFVTWDDAIREAVDPNLRRLAIEARDSRGELSAEIVDEAVERRGFLLVFRRAAFANRSHAPDPAGPGSIVALPPGQGFGQADLYAIIPQSNVDLEDLKAALATLPPVSRKAFSGRFAPTPPARVVVGQTRARRS